MSESSNQAQETVDKALCARFREIRKFYAKTQFDFAELFKISRSTVSDIEREAINPPKALLVEIVGRGDFLGPWVIRGKEPKRVDEGERTVAPALPSESDRWMARQAVEGFLMANSLEKKASGEQREFLAKHLAQSAAMGATPQALEQELHLLLDLLRKAQGRKVPK